MRENAEREPDPAFPYAHKKAQMEKIFEQAHQEGDFSLTIIRPAATYEDMRAPLPLIGGGTLVLHRLKNSQPLILLGDGSTLWAFSHRDDVAPAFVAALDNPATVGRAYHVTGEEWMTWEEYFRTAARVMGVSTVDFVRIPTELLVKFAPKAAEWSGVNFQFNNLFDNSAAREDLGFRYTISWDEGVRRMVAYHDAHGAIDACPPNPLYDRIIEEWQRISSSIASLEN